LEPESHNPFLGQTGAVRVRYSHYNKEFPIKDGVLEFADIDDQYCISFAFKGEWTASLTAPGTAEALAALFSSLLLLLPSPALLSSLNCLLFHTHLDHSPELPWQGEELSYPPQGGVLTKMVSEDGEVTVTGQFTGLELHRGQAEGSPMQHVDKQQAIYELHVEEDPVRAAAEVRRQREAHAARQAAGETVGGVNHFGQSMAQAHITAELKGMSAAELREGGERYRQLLEARELEACMREGMT